MLWRPACKMLTRQLEAQCMFIANQMYCDLVIYAKGNLHQDFCSSCKFDSFAVYLVLPSTYASVSPFAFSFSASLYLHVCPHDASQKKFRQLLPLHASLCWKHFFVVEMNWSVYNHCDLLWTAPVWVRGFSGGTALIMLQNGILQGVCLPIPVHQPCVRTSASRAARAYQNSRRKHSVWPLQCICQCWAHQCFIRLHSARVWILYPSVSRGMHWSHRAPSLWILRGNVQRWWERTSKFCTDWVLDSEYILQHSHLFQELSCLLPVSDSRQHSDSLWQKVYCWQHCSLHLLQWHGDLQATWPSGWWC